MPPLFAVLALATIPAQTWQRVPGPTVGPIESLAVAPAGAGGMIASVRTLAPYPIYLGAELAWSRRGTSWTTRWSDAYPVLTDVETDPSRPGVLWGANYGSVLQSLDGGLTWITSWSPQNPVQAVAVDPNDPDHVFGVGEPIVSSEFHRSLDGGQSWTDVFHFNLIPADVAVVPRAVLVGGAYGVLRSTDFGDTFSTVLDVPWAPKLAVAAGNPIVVWCLAGDVGGATEVHRSLDGGLTFARTSSPATNLSSIAAHPTDPDAACVATVASGVFTTLDGGTSWIRGVGIPDTAYLRTIRVDPDEPSHLFGGGCGSQGGVWFSADFGLHWRPGDRGLSSSVPKLLFDPAGRPYASGLGVPIRRSSRSAAWDVLDHPEGSTSFVGDLTLDPAHPKTIAWINDLPQWYLPNVVWLSSDDGRTWQDWTPPAAHFYEFDVRVLRFDREGTLYAVAHNGHFFRRAVGSIAWSNHDGPWGDPSDFVPDPSDPSVIHVTDSTLYCRSVDGGRTWSTGAAGLAGAYSFSDLTVNPLNSDELYVLANDSPTSRSLFKSSDRGASFAPVGAGLPAQSLACLALDPDVDGRLLVGTKEGSVLLSSDHGATFVPFQDGIDDAPVFSIAFDPTRTSVAWMSQAGGGLFERALP